MTQGIKTGCRRKRACTPEEEARARALYTCMYPKLVSFGALFNRRYDADKKEDAIEEVLAWSWQWILAAARNGTLQKVSPYRCAQFASRMYSTGRRFGACVRTQDAMSEIARARGSVKVESLDNGAPEERYNLTDKRAPLPYDVARRNVDYGLLEERLTPAPREVFKRLTVDHERGCKARIARDLGITKEAVSFSRAVIARKLVSLEYAKG